MRSPSEAVNGFAGAAVMLDQPALCPEIRTSAHPAIRALVEGINGTSVGATRSFPAWLTVTVSQGDGHRVEGARCRVITFVMRHSVDGRSLLRVSNAPTASLL